MQTPLVLDASVQLAARLAAQAPSLRFSGLAWEALLASPFPDTTAPNGAQLSPTARMFAQVLDASARESLPALTLRVDKTAGQAPPQQVAAALADAISGSGMFFESHLADWVQGAQNAASVLAEAQLRAATDSGTAGTALFQQQVSALATGEMAFLLPAWPGQTVALTISGEPGPGQQKGAAERSFFAHLETDLPELGPVHAVLSLKPHGIDVDLRASAPPTAQALDENRNALARALVAAGLRVGRIEVGNGL
ncbi:MAG: flagellar hook-length control protein FliK [Betaproteobacteria bacterium]|nr:flagellar hook-length control protein FliK [Betaproteobacteria bacterium]